MPFNNGTIWRWWVESGEPTKKTTKVGPQKQSFLGATLPEREG